jgi:hypothetical protein
MMRRMSVVVGALFVLAAADVPANAQKPAKNVSPSGAVVGECFKKHGGSFDPVRNRWVLRMGEMDATPRLDAVRRCIADASGVPAGTIRIREFQTLRGP